MKPFKDKKRRRNRPTRVHFCIFVLKLKQLHISLLPFPSLFQAVKSYLHKQTSTLTRWRSLSHISIFFLNLTSLQFFTSLLHHHHLFLLRLLTWEGQQKRKRKKKQKRKKDCEQTKLSRTTHTYLHLHRKKDAFVHTLFSGHIFSLYLPSNFCISRLFFPLLTFKSI